MLISVILFGIYSKPETLGLCIPSINKLNLMINKKKIDQALFHRHRINYKIAILDFIASISSASLFLIFFSFSYIILFTLFSLSSELSLLLLSVL